DASAKRARAKVHAPCWGALVCDQRTPVAWANTVAIAVARKASPATMARRIYRRDSRRTLRERGHKLGNLQVRGLERESGGNDDATPDSGGNRRPLAALLPRPGRNGRAFGRHDLVRAARRARGGQRREGPQGSLVPRQLRH